MECNKGDSQLLIEKARKHVQWGQQNLDTARMLLEKAERMYPSQDAKDLLKEIQPRLYSEAQIMEVQRVLQAKNPYEILKVDKHTTMKNIVKAFKKMSLLLHPDKNRAPGAHLAFQTLQEAKQKLLK